MSEAICQSLSDAGWKQNGHYWHDPRDGSLFSLANAVYVESCRRSGERCILKEPTPMHMWHTGERALDNTTLYRGYNVAGTYLDSRIAAYLSQWLTHNEITRLFSSLSPGIWTILAMGIADRLEYARA